MNKNLSVIIPHYNMPDLLERMITSVGIHQDVEIIVVDDNSGEKTELYEKLIREYSDKIIFLSNKGKNRGAGAARNYGLKFATGKWILFADSDDFFLDDWYDTVSRHFNDDVDIVYFYPMVVGEGAKNDPVAIWYGRLCRGFIQNVKNAEKDLRYRFVTPWSKLISHSLLESNKITFDEIKYSEDVMFSVKSGYYAQSVDVDMMPIYCYVKGYENQQTADKSEAAFWEHVKVECAKYKFLETHGEPSIITDPFLILKTVIARNYGLKNFLKYYKLLRKTGVKIFDLKKISSFVKHRSQKMFYQLLAEITNREKK